MNRFAALLFALALFASTFAAPARHQEKDNDKNFNENDEDDDEYSDETYASANADDGSIGVGVIDGGKFGVGGDSGGDGDGGHGGNHGTNSYGGIGGDNGAVVLNINKRNTGNKKKNGNKQPEFDTATLEEIFGSNGGNNGFPIGNGNPGNPNKGNEAQYSKEHGANHNFAGEAGIGSNHGHTKSDNSGNAEEPWIWAR